MLQVLLTLLGYAGVSIGRILANELVRWAVILVRLGIAAGITGYLLVQVLTWFFDGVFNAVNIGILIPVGLLQFLQHLLWLAAADIWVPVAVGIIPAKIILTRMRMSIQI